jgi:Rrf2 family transcriptional regulator, iron-sulfur cluster assembly transcription factor
MLLSRACEYAIQAALYLAEHDDTPYISVKEIAERNEISFHFLGKIVQTLTQKGILASYKGPKGGVRLARPPEEITVLQIVEAIDGLAVLQKCVLGLPECGDEHPCALHNQWGRIRAEIYEMLNGKSIAQLLREQ